MAAVTICSDFGVPKNKVCFGEGNGTPLQYSCLENPMDGGAWKAAVHGVPEGQTRLSDFTFTFHFQALEKEMATHSRFLPGETQGRGAWWAAVSGVTQSWTRLKRLSSSSRKGNYLVLNFFLTIVMRHIQHTHTHTHTHTNLEKHCSETVSMKMKNTNT